MNNSSIEWTEKSWNPTTGCIKISAGCKYCYAATLAKRLKAMGVRGYENGFELSLMPDRLDQPKKMRKPRMIFVNSMSDLFFEEIPFDYIDKVFATMIETGQNL